ncbi:right-handed parallel beta-helix repeat-containing protein [Pararhodonellum marinum]|uniref:right-handed parallel beta-helix repeat-containing protein n=1 Tax=Pararhodonellum marinum TaxID=2755358 RepID=UPI00188F6867|nr:right-handed parallel beta-helix repeat-containing protein [Pararhodonellum marinum]
MKNFQKAIFFSVIIILLSSPLDAKSWYVSKSGHDQNRGSLEAPFGSLEKGLRMAVPGDSVIVRQGKYELHQGLTISKRGTQNQWISLVAFPGEEVLLDGEKYTYDSEGNHLSSSNHAIVLIKDATYFRMVGFTVANSHSQGIIVRGPGTTDIEVLHCKVDNTYGSGIGLWYSDRTRVAHCEITGANRMNMATTGRRIGSEAPHEALTVAGATHFIIQYNHLHHCDKEGIDVKEVSRNGIVHHNYVHDLKRQGLYVDAWFGELANIELFGNVVHDCEWGFVISVEGEGSLVNGVNFHHNLLYDNRGSGIYFGKWGHDLLRKNIRIAHNTVVNNGTPKHWAAPVGGLDLRSEAFENVQVEYNIFFGNYGYDMAVPFPASTEREQILFSKNLSFGPNWVGKNSHVDESSSYGSMYAVSSEIISKAVFEDPEAKSFFLNPEQLWQSRLWPEHLDGKYFGAFNPYPPQNKPLP